MNDVCAAALLALSGAATPSIAPRPNRSGFLRQLLLKRIGREGCDDRAAARQNAENGAEHRAAQNCRRGVLQVLLGRHQARDLLLHEVAIFLATRIQIADDFRKAEQAHGDRGKAQTVGEFRNVERHARRAGLDVRADHGQQQTEHDHRDRLQHRALGKHHGEDQAEHHQREVFCRTERKRELGERRAEHSDKDRRNATRKERADCCNRERRTGTALLRHLEAVERSHDGTRFTRNIDQDRRGRTTILRAVIDAGEHDQRADRRQAEGDRQQHGHRGNGADARQNADQRTD
jgi:hypothetical protein